jgi:uncharacterized membrane protein YkvA (DUF1232 family)
MRVDEHQYLSQMKEKIVQLRGGPLRVLEEALTLYFCLVDRTTPVWAKTSALGAVLYFIVPTDLIPDVIPVAGLSDDASVVSGALTQVYCQITADHRLRARAVLKGGYLGMHA